MYLSVKINHSKTSKLSNKGIQILKKPQAHVCLQQSIWTNLSNSRESKRSLNQWATYTGKAYCVYRFYVWQRCGIWYWRILAREWILLQLIYGGRGDKMLINLSSKCNVSKGPLSAFSLPRNAVDQHLMAIH